MVRNLRTMAGATFWANTRRSPRRAAPRARAADKGDNVTLNDRGCPQTQPGNPTPSESAVSYVLDSPGAPVEKRPFSVNALGKFKARGVAFISYQENVDTTTPQGEL